MTEEIQKQPILVMGIANRWSLAYAIAKSLREAGTRLLLTYQAERVRKAVEELGESLGATQVYPCDVSQDGSLAGLFTQVSRDLGETPLAGLVHSIAFAQKEDLDRAFHATSRSGFNQALDVSAYSLVAAAHHAAPLMKQGGSIVTLSYLGAQRVVPNYNVMGVAKAALEAAVRYLASELGPQGIRVNAISAGPVRTASARAVRDLGAMIDHVARHAPLRRAIDPGEVADAARFLLSPAGRGITGDTLFIDSGYHIMGF